MGDIDGTVYGATWTEGLVDGALQFDGIDDYVNLGSDPTLAPDQFTICMWINAEATSDSRSILRKATDYRDNDYRFELFSARYPTFSFGDGSQNTMLRCDSELPLGEWTHIVATFDSTGPNAATLTGIKKLYVNGELAAESSTQSYVLNEVSPLLIGAGENEIAEPVPARIAVGRKKSSHGVTKASTALIMLAAISPAAA